VQPITLAVLKGFLEPWVGERVNYVNASVLAQTRGIRVIESKAAEPEDFVSLVTLRIHCGTTQLRVSGTIFGRTQPRIVRVEDFLLEAIPEGSTLLIQNEDRPGIVGHVGTLLGDAGINISRMQLGLRPGGSEALQLMNVVPTPEPVVLERLKALDGMRSVRLIELGESVA
jgi:D-3-phosphoglycerate dehydrogenase